MSVNAKELEAKVKEMYRDVATNPRGEFHFEMGRTMAERLGYLPEDLDCIPSEAIESFAGVGYSFHLANPLPGETVVDLGSGSGMDTFVASLKVGSQGEVIGIDMTDEQLAKAEFLRRSRGFENLVYRKGYIEESGLDAHIADCVISNGVINLATKARCAAKRLALLKRGGRLAISDIVTDIQLPEAVVCNADLWAACIGGAARRDHYRSEIEKAGFEVDEVQETVNTDLSLIARSAQPPGTA